MKTHEFLNTVPKSFKTASWAVAACSVVAGAVVAVVSAIHPCQISVHRPTLPALHAAQSLGMGLLVAAFACPWILCLGYVYADAHRRAMPPLLWTLVAAFVPNLLGFLLYFACRRPIAVPCPHCGQPNAPDQRFCSWCGHPASGPLASGGSLA